MEYPKLRFGCKCVNSHTDVRIYKCPTCKRKKTCINYSLPSEYMLEKAITLNNLLTDCKWFSHGK